MKQGELWKCFSGDWYTGGHYKVNRVTVQGESYRGNREQLYGGQVKLNRYLNIEKEF